MTPLAAFLFAICKAVPAAEGLLAQLVELYSTWKREQNLTDEKSKNARNAAAVDAALRGVPKLCDACPYAVDRGGQHGAAAPAPAVPGGGAGGA